MNGGLAMQRRRRFTPTIIAGAALAASAAAWSQSAEEMNSANNPLTPTIALNFNNAYVDSFYGLPDADSNAFLVRGALPHKAFDLPQITRVTLPVVTSPDLPPSGSHTDLVELHVLVLLVLYKV